MSMQLCVLPEADKKQQENNTLWLKDGEPSIEEVLELFSKYDLNIINELVFCGFGEPLERLEDVCAVIDSLKNTYPNLKVRLNTIGLANLIYGEMSHQSLRADSTLYQYP